MTVGVGCVRWGCLLRHGEHLADVSAADEAGATITRAAAETFYGGYAGAFCDLDGHSWEIAHNPGFSLADDGTITLPDFSAD